MKGSGRLRELLASQRPVVAVGAHDALSARLIADAGFDAVWASGFGISTANAVPDANILTMTETLGAVKRMIEAVPIPVIADCDSGYGNAINVMRTVREFSHEGAAGLCLEDNVFPKRCSFYSGVQRELVPAEEHAGKIRAARSAAKDPDFLIIARTEALIAGLGMDEALKRARAYADAGADAILVHSKAASADELREFVARWDGGRPLVAVPTTYRDTSVAELQAAGFRMVIFANQVLRGAMRAMQDTLRTLHETGVAAAVDDSIAPLADVYEIVGLSELQENERAYLGPKDTPTAVIIAAGFDPRLMPLTHDRPKGMLEVRGRSILEQQIQGLRDCGVTDIVIVRGHQKHAIDFPGVRYYDNARYRETGEVYSLFCAAEALTGQALFLYSDILFDPAIVHKLLRARADVAVVVDRSLREEAPDATAAREPDLVVTDGRRRSGHRFLPSEAGTRVHRIGARITPQQANGEFVGLAMFSARGTVWLREVYDSLAGRRGPFHEAPSVEQAAFTDLLQELIDRGHEIRSVDVYKGWTEVDSFADYQRAWGFAPDGTRPEPKRHAG